MVSGAYYPYKEGEEEREGGEEGGRGKGGREREQTELLTDVEAQYAIFLTSTKLHCTFTDYTSTDLMSLASSRAA